jgi:cyclopropane fatty-acyl-phospholipid synthase-like methyltransferase
MASKAKKSRRERKLATQASAGGGGRTRAADVADRHRLYELSVQNVEGEFEFVDETYEKLRGRKAHSLREDFCGTAAMACEWVRCRADNHAVAVDLDGEVLDWGRRHNVGALNEEQAGRVDLVQENVLTVRIPPVDVILAMNFSYMIFKTRDSLRDYFTKAREGLAEDGVLFLDAFGGYEAYKTMKERTRHDDFTYIWEQASYNPVNSHMVCHIHFAFPDKSKLKRAFTYEWRLWTLPELQELLTEAGFSKVTVYWQGWDEDDEPDGDFQPATEADADPGWVCFISAEK